MKIRRKRPEVIEILPELAPAPRQEPPADWRALRSQILADKRHGRLPRGGSEWLGPTAVVVPALGRTRPIYSPSPDVVRELNLSDDESRVAVKLGIYSVTAARLLKPILEVDDLTSETKGRESNAEIAAQFSLLSKLTHHLSESEKS